MSIFYKIAPHLESLGGELLTSLGQTFQMLLVSGIFAFFLGIFFGVLLIVTKRGGIMQNTLLYSLIDKAIDVIRSIPFIILMVAIIPLTRLLVGSSIGTTASIVPLTISAAPFIARIIESSLLEIDHGVIEAAQAMGASPMQIIRKVLLPEALHSIVLGITLALIGYSAMAGTLGGGGLGDLAIRYGYQRFQMDVMLITVVVLIVMVQSIQSLGDYFSKKLNKNKL